MPTEPEHSWEEREYQDILDEFPTMQELIWTDVITNLLTQ